MLKRERNDRVCGQGQRTVLGASDLANLMGATYVMAFGALAGTTKPGMLRALRRALRRLGTLRLRDLGLNRDAC